ncbi:MAG: ABC-type cobalamin/Fe3+-siderophores transport system, ATPase component [Candidatus Aminicenantes bacterium]|nr:ABC-type cobalamin/Fe3+-siderophores transport system, ATPase component [Candidatus Aminicenantes bacterium]
MAILEVRDLSAGYGNGPVISDISFSVEQGGFVAVLGRNGSGKSTLIKALQRLVRRVSGETLVEGESLSGMSRKRIARRIAYVPQIYDPVFEFTAAEVILMGRYVHQGRLGGPSASDAAVLAEVLRLTETVPLKDKKMAHLSGGERQRVYIARALAQDTPLLFLDEPSSHLDISFQVEIYEILRNLQKERGKTILAAEHNINLAAPYCRTLIFLKDGRIMAQGAPEELVTEENIRKIFDAEVDVHPNARSGLPEISLITPQGGKP